MENIYIYIYIPIFLDVWTMNVNDFDFKGDTTFDKTKNIKALKGSQINGVNKYKKLWE